MIFQMKTIVLLATAILLVNLPAAAAEPMQLQQLLDGGARPERPLLSRLRFPGAAPRARPRTRRELNTFI